MKILLRVLFVIFVVTTAISLAATIYQAIYRATRRDWLITTAEITFIATEDGLVFGTFTDCNGQVHSHHRMYNDGKFQNISIFTPWAKDPEPYLGTTVRIMYDMSTLAQEEICYTTANRDGEPIVRYWGIEIDSFDNWLRDIIASASVFGGSAVLLGVVIIIWKIRERAEKKSEGENGTEKS